MSADKSTILANAQLLTSRGQYDKAIAEWKKLATGAPADSTIYNTIGDLHLKRNAPAEAIEAFFQAGAAFRAEGAAVKAIAVYKKILKLDPVNEKAYLLLGDLNAERGLVTNAIAEYLTLTKLLLKGGRNRDAIEVYRTIAKLDPSNQEVRQRLAELCQQENMSLGGTAAPAKLAETGPVQPRPAQTQAARPEGPPAEAKRPAAPESLQEPDTKETPPEPGRLGFLDRAGQQISQGQYAEAESLLSEMLDREPGDPEVCRLLAQLHLKRGDLVVAKTEFQFLAEAAMRAHDYGLAESMLQEYLAVDPRSVGVIELLGRVYESSGNGLVAALQYGKAIELLVERPDPDWPTLSSELYDRIKTAAPTSPVVKQLAPLFEAPAVQQGHQPLAAQEPAREKQPTEQETQAVGRPAPSVAPAPVAPPGSRPNQVPESQGDSPDTDYQAHYELGVAYQNMGLLDEAIEELRLAIRGGDWFLDASRALASCLKEQGMNSLAISSLEQVLADSRCQGEAADAVRYDLGVLYEAEGLIDRALQMFALIPTFLDVPDRLHRITRMGQSEYLVAATGDLQPVPSTASSGASDGEPVGLQRKKRRISYL